MSLPALVHARQCVAALRVVSSKGRQNKRRSSGDIDRATRAWYSRYRYAVWQQPISLCSPRSPAYSSQNHDLSFPPRIRHGMRQLKGCPRQTPPPRIRTDALTSVLATSHLAIWHCCVTGIRCKRSPTLRGGVERRHAVGQSWVDVHGPNPPILP